MSVELKKLEVDGSIYYFHPETYRTYAVDHETTIQLDLALEHHDDARVLQLLGVDDSCLHNYQPDWDPTSAGTQVTLLLTESCNMRCRYCWQGNKKSSRHMSDKTAQLAVDFLMQHTAASGRIRLRFFGGEPLLRYDVIQQIMPYAQAKADQHHRDLLFIITTNGTLLRPPVVDFLARYRCLVDVSLDGLPEVHDKQRIYPNGSPTHAEVEKALVDVLSKTHPDLVSVSITIHHQSLPDVEKSVEYVRQLGVSRIRISPVQTSDPTLRLTRDDYNQLAAYLQTKYVQYGGTAKNPYQHLVKHNYLDRLDLKVRRRQRCVASHSGFCISPSGDIYPCSGFALQGLYALGHVKTGLEQAKKDQFVAACGTVDQSPVCQECWARYLCGGPCYQNSALEHQNLRCPTLGDCLESEIFIESALKGRIALAAKASQTNSI